MGRRNTRVEVCLQGSQLAALIGQVECPSSYPATFFACFLTFAHRFFAPLIIAALPAADRTRFFTPLTSRSAECPRAFAAARTPLNWEFRLLSCFSNFLSSRLIAARMFMNPPQRIYLKRKSQG